MYTRNLALMVLLAVGVIAGAAYLALGTPSPDPARVERMVRDLDDGDPDVRREAEEGIRRAGPAAADALRRAAKSPDAGRAARAATLLREMNLDPAEEGFE